MITQRSAQPASTTASEAAQTSSQDLIERQAALLAGGVIAIATVVLGGLFLSDHFWGSSAANSATVISKAETTVEQGDDVRRYTVQGTSIDVSAPKALACHRLELRSESAVTLPYGACVPQWIYDHAEAGDTWYYLPDPNRSESFMSTDHGLLVKADGTTYNTDDAPKGTQTAQVTSAR